MDAQSIPDIVIGRLPLYLRAITEYHVHGRKVISSRELGERLGLSSAQIRKDLSHFGEFGKQGTGYDIEHLANHLRRILNLQQSWSIALVGAGDLGTAIANYKGFAHRGFRIVAVYDNDLAKIGKQAGGFTIQSTETMVEDIRQRGLKIAMLAVPASAAQSVAEQLVEAGVEALLCYAPTSLSLPARIQVQYTDPVVHIQHMTYYLTDGVETPLRPLPVKRANGIRQGVYNRTTV